MNHSGTTIRASASPHQRGVGALLGLAIGDALGMPTQSFSRGEIARRFGRLEGLRDAPADQPVAPGMAAGSITDDTEQALMVADLLIAGSGTIDAAEFAAALRAWEASMIAKGSLDLLGPSTRAALAALDSSVSAEEAGRAGTTNGAAMRIAPVGIAFPNGPALLDAVVMTSRVTHNTNLGLSSAAAVAAAVSAGVDGADMSTALAAGVEAAARGASRGHWEAGASIAQRFMALREQAGERTDDEFTTYLDEVVGTSVQSQESVVSALLIADRYRERPFEGLCVAASIGGDTDTIGAIAGAILGATLGGDAFPASVREHVGHVNDLHLDARVEALLTLRKRSGDPT